MLFYMLLAVNTLLVAFVFTPVANHLLPIAEVKSDLRRADAVILLSSELYDDNHLGRNGYQRLFLAHDLYKRGLAGIIIVTGGPSSGKTSRAECMKSLLKRSGIPENDIMAESSSRNTYENLRNAAEIMKKSGLQTALLVTSCIHMNRALQTARRLGMDVYPAPVSCYEASSSHPELNMSMLYERSREMIATLYFRIKGWM